MGKVIKAILFIAALLGCYFFGLYVPRLIKIDIWQLMLIPVILLVSAILQIVIHEFGHLVAGLLSGYKFSSFRILSLAIISDNGRIRFKKQSIAGTGGQCIMKPPQIKSGVMPYRFYLAAGVLFNLLSIVITLPLLFAGDGVLTLSIACFCIVAAFFASTNGIPMSISGIPNDYKNLLSLRQNPSLIKYLYIQLLIVDLSQKQRLKDIPAEYFELPPPELRHEILAGAVAVFRCNRLIDAHDFNSARELGEKLLNEYGLVDLYKFLILCDLLFIELIGENRADVISGLILRQDKQLKKAMAKFPSVVRTDYALELLHNKNPESAEKCLSEFKKISKSYAVKTDIESETELIEIAKGRAAIS